MGTGSFGINTAFIASNSIRKGYGGYGVYDENENKEPEKKFSWIWFSINLILFLISLYTLLCLSCGFSKYIRVGLLVDKHQSAYQHKSHYYPEYYFTVKWNDREKEVETFEVSGETFFSCKPKENVYFKRLKSEYEWVKGDWGLLGFAVCGMIWLISGLAAILKNV